MYFNIHQRWRFSKAALALFFYYSGPLNPINFVAVLFDSIKGDDPHNSHSDHSGLLVIWFMRSSQLAKNLFTCGPINSLYNKKERRRSLQRTLIQFSDLSSSLNSPFVCLQAVAVLSTRSNVIEYTYQLICFAMAMDKIYIANPAATVNV